MMRQQLFGKTNSGFPVYSFLLSDTDGISVTVCNYGCRILRLSTPDRNGFSKNIVLGYDQFPLYERDAKYAGAAVGRIANVISNAQFEMDGAVCRLTKNDSPHHLHGGIQSFSNIVWDVLEQSDHRIVFSHRFPGGLDGYPGNLDVKVIYSLPGNGALHIRYEAVSDQKTPVSFTNHSYFNLDADFNREVTDYLVQIEAERYLELSQQALPTGAMMSVDGSIFDFRKPRTLEHIGDSTLQNTRGYDHTFLLSGSGMRQAASAYSPYTGRRIRVYTDLPALQFYTSNFPEEALILNDGVPDRIHNAVCFETQYATDFVHHTSFPGKYLLPGERYSSETIYRFDVV
ncbi:aldose epimerase family protein [Massiliimalia massiliensis]|uniref:aldose epimerase family protein n=1 Tax=Massiliimalia massiliensis TaxID=1852384 RepID=UPI000985217F|nr:aldose epimerase family protein [Massiliimalia massiliensis]